MILRKIRAWRYLHKRSVRDENGTYIDGYWFPYRRNFLAPRDEWVR